MSYRKKLSRQFYQQPTLEVSRQLLGKYLVRKTKNGVLIGKITETEAYFGFSDRASHASKRKTQRNYPMFYQGGYSYVYLVYGMHYCLNIVTEKEGFPSAVLIRAVKTALGASINGPGRVSRYFSIDKSFNALDLCNNSKIWLEDRGKIVLPNQIVAAKRIGVDYAGKYWAARKWRFLFIPFRGGGSGLQF